MSVFKLPKDLCDRLTSAMTEYWWSSGSNKKKISWVAWQKLCKHKEEGGLGFHDISTFNQSLLAKQAWRILNNPSSLVARVLKSKYWKNGDFMNCGLGTRPSFAWRSIIHGRELLAKGMVMKIGDGMATKVWSDNWIIDPLPRPPMYHPEADIALSCNVSDLLIPNTNLWDAQTVRRSFVEDDANRILSMRIDRHKSDTWGWGFTKDGVYTSRSGYKLLASSQAQSSPHTRSLPPVEKKLWRSIWKLHTSPKIRHFIWRALSGALAVADQLRSRGIPVDATCKLCGTDRETICHTLFLCPQAHEVWRAAHLPLPPAGFSSNSVFLNIHYLLACTRRKELPLSLKRSIPWLLWHIWKARNSLIFKKIRLYPDAIADKADEDSKLWFDVNFPASDDSRAPL